MIQPLWANDTLLLFLRAYETVGFRQEIQSLRANDTNCFGQMPSGLVRHDRINTLASKGPYFTCPHGGLPKVNCLARRIVSITRRDCIIYPKQSVSFARLSIVLRIEQKIWSLDAPVFYLKKYIYVTSVFSKLVSFLQPVSLYATRIQTV